MIVCPKDRYNQRASALVDFAIDLTESVNRVDQPRGMFLTHPQTYIWKSPKHGSNCQRMSQGNGGKNNGHRIAPMP
jgi:hypothetical protein